MTIEVQKKDHIARITINRPEARNALDMETVTALANAWKDFRDDASMRVAIITGVGNSFCAGADLGSLIPQITGSPDGVAGLLKGEMGGIFQAAMLRDFELWKPVVAAVNGYCFIIDFIFEKFRLFLSLSLLFLSITIPHLVYE